MAIAKCARSNYLTGRPDPKRRTMNPPLKSHTSIEEIIENFSYLDDWEDRYGYLIELGGDLTDLPREEMCETNRVRGCASQVWLINSFENGRLTFNGASDAHIVRGLVAVALSLFSGKTPETVLSTDEQIVFRQIGLGDHLTPQRSNGLKSLVNKIKSVATSVLSET